MSTYYLEYKIVNNRPGLLGDLASLFGLLKINIETIASIESGYRGLLIKIDNDKEKKILHNALQGVTDLKMTAFREPGLFDLLALKHGKKVKKNKKTNSFLFNREDLELLIDFLSEHLKHNSKSLIGFKGSPRIGKTETAIAASIHANKNWQLISSTLLRKIARTKISDDFLNQGSVFIIDAITTFYRSTSEHILLVKKILKLNLPRIIEHPEILIKETEYNWEDFDLIIELVNGDKPSEKLDKYMYSFNSFDIS